MYMNKYTCVAGDDMDEKEIKMFTMRMPLKTWLFLKKEAAHRGTSMMKIIVESVGIYKDNKKEEKETIDR